ncbi:cation diffusion facilitator family transporter [Alicyclobacillus tolerans]|uniref:cation diffusion facilitator family transporter n=1 Tax=Alicyclobacillus tolerans TaxID=90970 RepID=UPI001F242C18|nr:cation diffusion facilitator family transporter [Alicyclobacillus tolerans]MCF8565189.1 cation diffusion facilitator family transporter [Alicyclobacillus tolerans]
MTRERHSARAVRIAAWSSAIVNIVLTVGKGAIGLSTGSRALFADAVHSAADVVGSIAVIVGLRIARKPPDEDHPYGHGKAELISSALVGVALILAAVQVGYESVNALFHPAPKPELLAAYTAAASIVVKEIMFHYNYRLGKRLHSKGLLASAYDHRSDVYSSMAALGGILLSLLGQWLGVNWLLHMDAVAGALVALLVLWMGYKLARESLQILMDKVVGESDLKAYQDVVVAVPGVEHTDELRARDHGQYVIVDVKISVAADITVAQGHSIAAEVKQQLKEAFPRVQDVFVHVNPFFNEEREERT